MYGLPITLTPQQQIACGARKWKGLTQTEQMGVLITIFAELANMPITCQTLQTYAAQFSCLPPGLQLPALIYLASEILAAGGSGGGGGTGDVVTFSSGGLGTPPPFAPQVNATQYAGVSTGAIATDISTGRQWNFINGAWQ
jgi:hypothetical protein